MRGRAARHERGPAEAPPSAASWRPVAYLTVRDGQLRARLRDLVRRQGWAVVDSSVAQHLLQALAGPLRRDEPWLRPGLVVLDSLAAGGCAHAMARELRALSRELPIVILSGSRPPAGDDPERGIHSVDPAIACEVVAGLVRRAAAGNEPPS